MIAIDKIRSGKKNRALLALILAGCVAMLAACGGGGTNDEPPQESAAANATPSATMAPVAPEPSPSTEQEVQEVEEVAEAIDAGDFPYTVTLGPGWTVKASIGGGVIVEKDNGLTLSMQHTIYGEEGITLDKLEESVKATDDSASEITRGKAGEYDALMFNSQSISEEGTPATRVAYVIAENDTVIGIALGGKAGEDAESIGYTVEDIDAAFGSVLSSFRVK